MPVALPTPAPLQPQPIMQNRRQLLRTSLGAALAPLASCQHSSQSSGWIDAHVHVWTPDLERYPLAEGFTRQSMQPPSFTPEQLFAHAKPQGVSRIVLIQMSYYRFDNRYMLDMMRRHPGTFSGVAIVDDKAADVEQRMLELARQGVRGFRLVPPADPVAARAWFASPGIETMYRVGAQHRLNMCLLINPEALGEAAAMCRRFPKTPVVIDHFARLGMAGAIEPAGLKALLDLAAFPEVTVKTSATYALGAKKAPYTDLLPMLRACRDAFGAKRLMWASDCPFQVEKGHNYKDSIDLVHERADFLTERERQWLLRDTAQRVFFS